MSRPRLAPPRSFCIGIKNEAELYARALACTRGPVLPTPTGGVRLRQTCQNIYTCFLGLGVSGRARLHFEYFSAQTLGCSGLAC